MIGETKRRAKRAFLRAAIHGDPLAIRVLGPSRLAVWRRQQAICRVLERLAD
jgi:hypothetical protein